MVSKMNLALIKTPRSKNNTPWPRNHGGCREFMGISTFFWDVFFGSLIGEWDYSHVRGKERGKIWENDD